MTFPFSLRLVTTAVLFAMALPVSAETDLTINVNGQLSSIHKDETPSGHQGPWVGALDNANSHQTIEITAKGERGFLDAYVFGGWGSESSIHDNKVVIETVGTDSFGNNIALAITGSVTGAFSSHVGEVSLNNNLVIAENTMFSPSELASVYGARSQTITDQESSSVNISATDNKVVMVGARMLGYNNMGALIHAVTEGVAKADRNQIAIYDSELQRKSSEDLFESVVAGARLDGRKLTRVQANQNSVLLDNVNIASSNISVTVKGAQVNALKDAQANDNQVQIRNSNVTEASGAIVKTQAGYARANRNTLSIVDSTIETVAGIKVAGAEIESSNNLIELTGVGGLMEFVGVSIDAKDQALISNNTIYLEEVKANKEVVGFAIAGEAHQVQMKNNRVVLVNSDIADLQGLKWVGESRRASSEENNLGVELQVEGTNHLGSLSGVNSIRFEVATAKDNNPMLTVDQNSTLKDATVTINTLNSDKKNATLIEGGLTLENVTLKTEGTFGEKVLEVDALNGLSMNSDAVVSLLNQKTQFNQSVQTLTDARMGTVAMIMQGQDVASSLLHNADHPWSTFAQMTGDTYRYDWGNGMDLNGGSLTLGAAGQVKEGLQGVVFAQFGWANADTEVAGARGDSDLNNYAFGAGIHHQTALPLYLEALATIGMTQTQFEGRFESDQASFDSDTFYASMQFGMGTDVVLTPNLNLNLYGHYALTYLDGDRVHLKNRFDNRFETEDVWAHTLRFGTRLSGEVASNAQWYTGVGYERLLHGDIKASIDSESLDSVALKGNTGVFEAGVSLAPQHTSPWILDLNVKAYAGDRQGMSASASMRYLF